MKIFFAASEMAPYAKTGGLGDVVSALPTALRQLGHEVTCCLPFYRAAQEVARDAKPIGLTLQIPLGSRTVTGDVLELKQADGVRVLFVRRDEFFDRSELYYTGVRDYEDNAERFLFFSKAVVELLGYTQWDPATDAHLGRRYTPEDLSGKRACRADLLAKLGLEAGEGEPVAAFVS